jgi:hypothetical protein
MACTYQKKKTHGLMLSAPRPAQILVYVRQHPSTLQGPDVYATDVELDRPITSLGRSRFEDDVTIRPLQHSTAVVATLGAALLQRPAPAFALAHSVAAESENNTDAVDSPAGCDDSPRLDDHNVSTADSNRTKARAASLRGKEPAEAYTDDSDDDDDDQDDEDEDDLTQGSRSTKRRLAPAPKAADPAYKTRQQLQTVVDVLLAAEYLQVPRLAAALVKVLADWMVGLTPAQIRAQFDLPADLDHAAINELRCQLAWTTRREPSPPVFARETYSANARASEERQADGGWNDLPWPLQQQVLRCYRSVAPDAHLVLALFVCHAWRRAFPVWAPQAPDMVARQLLATGPTGATLYWAFGEVSMPAQWLSEDAARDVARHPNRRALLSWFIDRDLLSADRIPVITHGRGWKCTAHWTTCAGLLSAISGGPAPQATILPTAAIWPRRNGYGLAFLPPSPSFAVAPCAFSAGLSPRTKPPWRCGHGMT